MRRGLQLSVICLLSFCAPRFLEAAIPLYRKDSGVSVDLGIRIQLQYYRLGSEGWSEQKLYFPRLRPSLELSLSPEWEAEAEIDFGDTVEGEAIEFKDMFLSYRGAGPRGWRVTLGNEKAVFSRQFQSSSKSLTLVDRGFVGLDEFGTLDRVLGARVERSDAKSRLTMAGSFGLASHQPDDAQMEFESPLNDSDDASRGMALSGRLELAPFGPVDYDQGDFGSDRLRLALGASAYRWSRTGSASPGGGAPGAVDLDRARGLEVSGAVRGRGLSADAELQWVRGASRDRARDGGLYRGGEAELAKLSFQTGVMVLPRRVELAAGFDRLDAEAYEAPWKRLSIGGTHYWKAHFLKIQVNYLHHWGFHGTAGENPQAVTTQLQIVF